MYILLIVILWRPDQRDAYNRHWISGTEHSKVWMPLKRLISLWTFARWHSAIISIVYAAQPALMISVMDQIYNGKCDLIISSSQAVYRLVCRNQNFESGLVTNWQPVHFIQQRCIICEIPHLAICLHIYCFTVNLPGIFRQ